MKFGNCLGLDLKRAALLGEAGYDYFETTLGGVTRMDDAEYAEFLRGVRALSIPCEASNTFINSDHPIVCESPDYVALREYAKKAMFRAGEIGIKSAVFGSGGARRVPDGIPRDKALTMIAYFLGELVAPEAEKNGVMIAIEPLTIRECNIINYVNDGRLVSKMVGKDCVKTLADIYHFYNNNDQLACISEVPGEVIHSHISTIKTRRMPAPADAGDYVPFLKALKIAGCERASLECRAENFETEIYDSLEALRTADRAADALL